VRYWRWTWCAEGEHGAEAVHVQRTPLNDSDFHTRRSAERKGELNSGLQEFLMQVWIGLKQNEEYVHEWTGEVAGEGDVGQAIGNAIADYRTKSGKTIWGMSIMVDRARPLPRGNATP
jgi:hypothetical protein